LSISIGQMKRGCPAVPRRAARRILAGIDRKQRLVHFPWPLSGLMKYVVHNLPGSTYDWLIGKVARREG
jgi:hypothetical protein